MIAARKEDLRNTLGRYWGNRVAVYSDSASSPTVVQPPCELLRVVAECLASECGYQFSMIVSERRRGAPLLHYVLEGAEEEGFILLDSMRGENGDYTRLSLVMPAAEAYERAIERDVGIRFESLLQAERAPAEERGSFIMPIGPVYSGTAESALFELQTCGENVLRASHTLEYKHRSIESLARGRTTHDALLLAERCNGRSAFAHGWAFARAVEAIGGSRTPERGEALRAFFAEIERYRSHVATIREVCESTGLIVAASQASILEEELLRLSGALCGHRYLFGVVAIGGITCDVDDSRCSDVVERLRGIHTRLRRLGSALRFDGTFFDRLENIGVISAADARKYALVGPVARASGWSRDARARQPYEHYRRFMLTPVEESEGDGAARVRVLFRECAESLRILRQVSTSLPHGPVRADVPARAGCGLGWVEAPRGITLHWVRCDEGGRVVHYQMATPSLRNWYGFHLAMEGFSFQDFPITLATLGLCVAESDR